MNSRDYGIAYAEVLSILEKVKYKSLIHIIEKFSDVEIGLE